MLLILGSRLLVLSATDFARILGISEAVIALTIIAVGTVFLNLPLLLWQPCADNLILP